MKRSRAVRLTLVASASSACASPSTPSQALHCVERGTNRVVADSLCDAARVAANGGRTGSFGATTGASGDFGGADTSRAFADRGRVYGSGPSLSPFLWYYGGRIASGFASAGSYAPLDGARYRSASGFVAGGARRGFFSRAFGRSGSSASEAGHAAGGAAHGAVSRGGFGATGAAHGGGAHGG